MHDAALAEAVLDRRVILGQSSRNLLRVVLQHGGAFVELLRLLQVRVFRRHCSIVLVEVRHEL